MSLKYYLGIVVSFPLLPIMYLQGKNIRKNVPRLPEARNPRGYIKTDAEKTLKIIAIGESTVAGVGVDFHKNGFIGALAKEISEKTNSSVLWRVYAKSGFTARMVRKRIVPEIEDSNADIIVIGLGGNDAFKLNSPEIWMHNIHLLIKDLKRKFPKTPIYFTNMPPIKEFPAFTNIIKFVVGNLAEILGKKLANNVRNKKNVHFNDEIISIETWKERYKIEGDLTAFFSDGVHPSKLTYQIWGKDMATFIMNTKSFK
ncbi:MULTISPECIES: SGNH/GDSL hydrolase family protein [unclassified Polaribacter]|uniref:SGNH/GDSL hydrolase family protein n=1 Tax=unclassified Polaribacter TaxID=196858 RepID=UPI0011BDB0E9|nr:MULTISPECIES: SGNH/GDSL hydrolase family protein [unclassified Polaribacter]TXD52068.1 SGNH/GDSL hydrolase family protein [Polaribacter sp. IC063]TXD59790.1 SGNH/GDSL hydrolase family protein [Polaribacter sp. IC066]